MTERKRRKGQMGLLTVVLAAGSLAATLWGTRLLGMQERAGAAGENSLFAVPVTVVVPAPDTSLLLPPDDRGEVIELAPIPQAARPQIEPVARSRSSR